MKKSLLPYPPLVLLIGAVMVSALLLAAFSFGTIKSQRLFMEREIEDKARTIAQGIGEQFDQLFDEIENTINTEYVPLLGRRFNPGSMGKDARTLPLRCFMALDERYNLVFPETPWSPPARLAIEAVKLSPEWTTAFNDAETIEISGQLEMASEVYERLLEASISDRAKALSLNLKARVHHKRNQLVQSQLAYDRLLQSYPAEVSLDGASLGAIAAFERAGILMEQGQEKAGVAAYGNMLKDIREKKIRCTRDELLFYRQMIGIAISSALQSGQVKPEDVVEYRSFESQLDEYQEAGQWAARFQAEGRLIGISTQRFDYTQLDGRSCLAARKVFDKPTIYLALLIDLPRLKELIQSRLDRNLRNMDTFRYEIISGDHQTFIVSRNKLSGKARIQISLCGRLPEWRIRADVDETGEMRWNARIRMIVNIGIIVFLLLVIGASGYALVVMMRKERELSRMKTDFVSRVSHEMRTPLTSIQMIHEMLQSGKVRDEARTSDYYKILSEETERLTRLINKVLDFSRMDSGRKPYEFSLQSIGPIVSRAVQVFETTAQVKGYSIHATLESDLPPVRADADALTEVILNLLDNAVKYSPEHKEITVNVGRQADWIRVAVMDRGIGINPADHDRIFEKFYRCDDEVVRQTRGTGVGLAIVRHIILAHQGRIEVQSRPGQGSTFIVLLPVVL